MLSVSDVFDIAAHVASILALVSAGVWFLYTSQFKPRIQFDLDCRFIGPDSTRQWVLAEVNAVFENRGFVEHRLYDLTLSIHGLSDAAPTITKTGEVTFARRLLPKTTIVPPRYGFYFVRPGVRQVIAHTIRVPADVTILRVTGGFNYTRDGAYPHTARRVFAVSASGSATSPSA